MKPLRDSPSLAPAPAVADSSTDTSSPHVTADLTSSGAARTSCPMQILTAFPRARLPLPCLFSRPFIFQIKQSLCGDSSSSHFSPPRRTLYQPLLCTIARRCSCVWCWRIFSVIFCPPRCLFCVFLFFSSTFILSSVGRPMPCPIGCRDPLPLRLTCGQVDAFSFHGDNVKQWWRPSRPPSSYFYLFIWRCFRLVGARRGHLS